MHIGFVAYYTRLMVVTSYRTHPNPELILALEPYVNNSSKMIVRDDQALFNFFLKGIALAFQFYAYQKCIGLIMIRRIITTNLLSSPSSKFIQVFP